MLICYTVLSFFTLEVSTQQCLWKPLSNQMNYCCYSLCEVKPLAHRDRPTPVSCMNRSVFDAGRTPCAGRPDPDPDGWRRRSVTAGFVRLQGSVYMLTIVFHRVVPKRSANNKHNKVCVFVLFFSSRASTLFSIAEVDFMSKLFKHKS